MNSAERRIILIVEDEPLIAFDLGQAIEEIGADVFVANRLLLAAKLLEQATPIGVILDRHLPDGDTIDLARQLVERGVPVIIYAGSTDGMPRCAGATFIEKPSSSEVVAATMQRLLTRKLH